MPRCHWGSEKLGLLNSFRDHSWPLVSQIWGGWGTTRRSHEYLHKGRFLKERATEIHAVHERFSAAVDPRSCSETPGCNSWASGLELESPQMLRHTLNWPAFRWELKINPHKVLNNHSPMARKGERGSTENIQATSRSSRLAPCSSISTSRNERQTNC